MRVTGCLCLCVRDMCVLPALPALSACVFCFLSSEASHAGVPEGHRSPTAAHQHHQCSGPGAQRLVGSNTQVTAAAAAAPHQESTGAC
jgi:hypothetical protein